MLLLSGLIFIPKRNLLVSVLSGRLFPFPVTFSPFILVVHKYVMAELSSVRKTYTMAVNSFCYLNEYIVIEKLNLSLGSCSRSNGRPDVFTVSERLRDSVTCVKLK